MAQNELDRTDKQILMELQRDGRLSNQELADRVSLSPSPCLRRVRRLEEEGYIDSYVALVNPDKVGLKLPAYVTIRLTKVFRTSHSPVSDFARDVHTSTAVVDCYALPAHTDYLLRVQVTDLTESLTFSRATLMQHTAE